MDRRTNKLEPTKKLKKIELKKAPQKESRPKKQSECSLSVCNFKIFENVGWVVCIKCFETSKQ